MSHDIQDKVDRSVVVGQEGSAALSRPTVSLSAAAIEFGMKPGTFVKLLVQTGLISLHPERNGRVIYREDYLRALENPAVLKHKREDVANAHPLGRLVTHLRMSEPALKRIVQQNGIPATVRGRVWISTLEVDAIEEVRNLFPPSHRARTVDRYLAVRLIGSELALESHLKAGQLERPNPALQTDRFDLFALLLLRVRRERGLVESVDREVCDRDALPKELVPLVAEDPDAALAEFERARKTISISDVADALGLPPGRAKRDLITTRILPANTFGRGAQIFEDTFRSMLESGALNAFRHRLPEGYLPVRELAERVRASVRSLNDVLTEHGVPFLNWGTPGIMASEEPPIEKAYAVFANGGRLRTINQLAAESILGSAAALEQHVKAGHLGAPTIASGGARYPLFSIVLLRFRREAGTVPVFGETNAGTPLIKEEAFPEFAIHGDRVLRDVRPTIGLGAAAARLGIGAERFRRDVMKVGLLRSVSSDVLPVFFRDEFEAFLQTDPARDLSRIGPELHSSLGSFA
ncbi:MAG: hypothetical protein IT290_00545, partial [Deltaproteobacteria bacterium]|nr:hypothetical protein [Deltaproteobacteria bacterium]